MVSESSSQQVLQCPSECGDTLYGTESPGVQFCETCEREYWVEGDTWFSCDVSGIPERVEAQ